MPSDELTVEVVALVLSNNFELIISDKELSCCCWILNMSRSSPFVQAVGATCATSGGGWATAGRGRGGAAKATGGAAGCTLAGHLPRLVTLQAAACAWLVDALRAVLQAVVLVAALRAALQAVVRFLLSWFSPCSETHNIYNI